MYLCRMFVRRKVNKSGSISVHVVDKARGKYRVVKVFGPVESEQEVARLERQARTYIREAGGGVDLFPDEADGSIEDFLSSVSNTQPNFHSYQGALPLLVGIGVSVGRPL